MNLVPKKKFLGSQIKTAIDPQESKDLLQDGKLNPAGIYTSTYNRNFNTDASLFSVPSQKGSSQINSKMSESQQVKPLDMEQIRTMSRQFKINDLRYAKRVNSVKHIKQQQNQNKGNIFRSNTQRKNIKDQLMITSPDCDSTLNSLYGSNDQRWQQNLNNKYLLQDAKQRNSMVSLDNVVESKFPQIKKQNKNAVSQLIQRNKQQQSQAQSSRNYQEMTPQYKKQNNYNVYNINNTNILETDDEIIPKEKLKEILSLNSLDELEQLQKSPNKARKIERKKMNNKTQPVDYSSENNNNSEQYGQQQQQDQGIVIQENQYESNNKQKQCEAVYLHHKNLENNNGQLPIPSEEDLIKLIPEEFLTSPNFNLYRFVDDNQEYILHLLGECACQKCSCGVCKCQTKPRMRNAYMKSTYSKSYVPNSTFNPNKSNSSLSIKSEDLHSTLGVRFPRVQSQSGDNSLFFTSSYQSEYVSKPANYFRVRPPEAKYNGQFSSLSSYNSQFMDWKSYNKQGNAEFGDNIPLPPTNYTKKNFQTSYNNQYNTDVQDFKIEQDKQAERTNLKILPIKGKTLVDKSHQKYQNEIIIEENEKFQDQIRQYKQQEKKNQEDSEQKRKHLEKLEFEHKKIHQRQNYKTKNMQEYQFKEKIDHCISNNLKKDLQKRIMKKLEKMKLDQAKKEKQQLDEEIATAQQSVQSLEKQQELQNST